MEQAERRNTETLAELVAEHKAMRSSFDLLVRHLTAQPQPSATYPNGISNDGHGHVQPPAPRFMDTPRHSAHAPSPYGYTPTPELYTQTPSRTQQPYSYRRMLHLEENDH